MSIQKPNFVDDPHFYVDENGFHLKDGAPESVKKEFEEYMEYKEELKKKGIYV